MFYNSYLLSNILIYIPVVSILNWYVYSLPIRYLKQDVNVITTVWLLAMKVAYLYLFWLAAVIFILLPMLSCMVSIQLDGTLPGSKDWRKKRSLQSFETLHFKHTYCVVIFVLCSHFRSVCIKFPFWLNICFL